MLLNLLNATESNVVFDDPFQSLPLELNYFLKVLIGGILGLAIGIERSRRQKEAGKATHFVVGTASTLLTCVSLWFKEAGDLGDGARIAAQIVTGVGFLGAGMIFFRRESLRGLTTAAGIWATAAIGMCVATGMIWLAVGSTALLISVQVLLHSKIGKRSTQHLLLLKLEYSDELKRALMDYFGIHNFHRFKISATNEKAADSSKPIALDESEYSDYVEDLGAGSANGKNTEWTPTSSSTDVTGKTSDKNKKKRWQKIYCRNGYLPGAACHRRGDCALYARPPRSAFY